MLNQIVLVGRISNDIEIKEVENKKVGVITLSIPRSWKNSEGEYDTDYIEKSLKLIAELNLIKNEGLIICESNSKDKIIYSDKFKQIKEKKYGDKWVVILEKIC